eukprot:1174808-Rhodomonas_salina.1
MAPIMCRSSDKKSLLRLSGSSADHPACLRLWPWMAVSFLSRPMPTHTRTRSFRLGEPGRK